MKAIVINQPGDPSVLEYVDVPTPAPGPGEVLVKASFIGVNRPELAVRRGTYGWMPPLPAIPGIEMAGTIAALGDGIDGIALGTKAFVTARDLPVRAGCYAEYIAVPLHAVRLLPDSVDLAAAACLASYQMAYYLFHVATHGVTGSAVLIDIASGGIGSAAVQLAKIHGMETVIALVGDARKAAALEAFGAHLAIDTSNGTIADQVLGKTNGKGVDVILNGAGGTTLKEQILLMAPLGTAVAYGGMLGAPNDPLGELSYHNPAGNRCAAVRYFNVHMFDDMPEYRSRSIDYVIGKLAAGAIRPLIHEVLPLSEAHRAHEILEARAAIGKILLTP